MTASPMTSHVLIALSVSLSTVAVMADDDVSERLKSARRSSAVTVEPGTHTSPLTIDRPLTLVGESRDECVLEVTADQPALSIRSKQPVVVEGLTIKWQLESSDGRQGPACALLIKDSHVTLKNCRLIALGGTQQCPSAVQCTGFSKVTIENCHFEGFDFTVNYSGGAEGQVSDCVILNPGHCGLSVFSGSKVDVSRTIVTGSEYHGFRCTGGTLLAHDNLIIANKNRGIYLGNKSAKGRIANNVIQSAGTGIGAFAQSSVTIENNVILDCTYAAIGTRDTCPLKIRNNVLMDNPRGIVVFEESGHSQLKLTRNTFWENETAAENFDLSERTLQVDPQFTAAEEGDFSIQSSELNEAMQGLVDSAVLREVWLRWKRMKESTAASE